MSNVSLNFILLGFRTLLTLNRSGIEIIVGACIESSEKNSEFKAPKKRPLEKIVKTPRFIFYHEICQFFCQPKGKQV